MNILGVDVSKDTLDCCLLIQNEPYYHKFSNNDNGFIELLKLYEAFKVTCVGFEATGNYHKKLEKYLYDNGVNPYILQPLKVSNYIKSLNIHGKTDKTDSYGIAMFLLKNDLREYLSFPTRDYFKPILTSLNLLDKQIQQNKNLLHSIDLYPETSDLLDELKDVNKYLTITKDRLEKKAIKLLYSKCPEAKEIKNEIAGVGDKLLLYLIPYLYDNFDKFTLKEINAFFGLNPVSFSSGSSVHKRDKLSHKGDKSVLKMLYMSSVSAVRNNAILKEKYNRLKSNGKHSKVALMAIMSHLLRAIVIKLSQKTKREIKK
ncbi:Mobile element protein [hydrothermal vent metagenome]|uniref:Mobile element protein n=1 Tax=hydrothermal vent metagenome TaxID=652676 RepID=A0A1W1BXI6_9ZZZZ